MKLNDVDLFEFWKAVYLQSVRAGRSPYTAKEDANQAVAYMTERWGV